MKKSKELIIPNTIRLDASTKCQLNCRSCPTGTGKTSQTIGNGILLFRDFKKIVDKNPFISCVELSNWGEIFLNEDLTNIIEYAYKQKIKLQATNGVNLNNADPKILEALVKYRFQDISCSLDGASQETYCIYRKNGNFNQVINNIKIINHFKKKYNSSYPNLKWKFIAFGHNEHEIQKARQMANDLNMYFYVKLAWENLYLDEIFSPIKDKDLIKNETGLGVSNRSEFKKKYGYEYILRECCKDLWKRPQINFDGRLLGCSVNYLDDFGNAFKDGLIETLNNEKINYAREMLMGNAPERKDIPCVNCKFYKSMKNDKQWILKDEVEKYYVRNTRYIYLKNVLYENIITNKLYRILRTLKHKYKILYLNILNLMFEISNLKIHKGTLKTGIYQLNIPFKEQNDKKWTPFLIFKGSTAILDNLTCHISVLSKDFCPHPPHTHDEEEILIVLHGEVVLMLPDMAENKKIHLSRGQFVYYPKDFQHSIQTVSDHPANYLMFKWKNERNFKNNELKFGKFDFFAENNNNKEGFNAKIKFNSSTLFLKRLQCHVTTLSPKSGYAAHRDNYDVAIVLIEGEVETLNKKIKKNGIIFYKAGQIHGMFNPLDNAAKYIVFEFHDK